MQMIQEERNNFQLGFLFIMLFCVFRPLALLDLKVGIAEFNAMELFAVIMSYLLLLPIFLNLRKIKLDLISISILWFCSYCLLSLIWGSQLRTVAQVTLPFILFFATRSMINEQKQISLLITVLIIAFCFPLIGSFYQIIQGQTIETVESISGIERYAGMFKTIKPLAFAMFFFSVFYYMQVYINQLRNRQIKWVLLFLLIISFFCLFKTYSRITFIGLFAFWTISFFGYNKKYFFLMLALSILVVIVYFSIFQLIFFKTQEFEINVATSGRLFLWEHNINYFLKSSFEKKMLGNGLGVLSPIPAGSEIAIASRRITPKILPSHNDFLQILMSLGIFGLFSYLLIFLALLKDVFISSIDKSIKYFYFGIIISIILINFGSGITVYQVGSSQLFWLVMGFFYVFRELDSTFPRSD